MIVLLRHNELAEKGLYAEYIFYIINVLKRTYPV